MKLIKGYINLISMLKEGCYYNHIVVGKNSKLIFILPHFTPHNIIIPDLQVINQTEFLKREQRIRGGDKVILKTLMTPLF
jgi:hypothetical protein